MKTALEGKADKARIDRLINDRFVDGSGLYNGLSNILGSDKDASQLLSQSGIVGVSVPTGNKQGGDGRGTNYVIFNEDDAKIVDHERYSISTKESTDFKSAIDAVADAKTPTAVAKAQKNVLDTAKAIEEAHNCVRYSIIGTKGAKALDDAEETTFRIDAINVAEQMENEGKDAKSIRLATGWERGKDGKWRYEIPDLGIKGKKDYSSEMDALVSELFTASGERETEIKAKIEELREQIKNEGNNTYNGKFGDIVDAEELFKAYPNLKDVDVMVMTNMGQTDASYNPGSMEIAISDKLLTQSAENIRSFLTHEVQHAIQYEEDFAVGGNSQMFVTPNNMGINLSVEHLNSMKLKAEYAKTINDNVTINELKDLYSKNKDDEDKRSVIAEMLASPNDVVAIKDLIIKDWNDAVDKIRKNYADSNSPFNKYIRIAGEVEARNTQTRLDMSEEERKNTTLAETEDMDREEQIVRYSIRNPKDSRVIKKIGEKMSVPEHVFSNEEIKSLIEENNVYNNELKKYRRGELDDSAVLHLGTTGSLLQRLGFPKLPIEMRARVIGTKASEEYDNNHPFENSEIGDLVFAINSPIMAFNSKTHPNTAKVLLLDIRHNDINFVASVQMSYKANASAIEINRISSLFPKDNILGIVEWIKQGNLLEFANKEKAIRWLIQQQSNSADVTNPNGFDVANLIRSFDNATHLTNTSTENSAINTDSKQGERFSITPQQDSDYMKAVELGNTEAAKKMVVQAAKAAMSDTKVVDEKGEPLVVYHGTSSNFWVFEKGKKGNRYAMGIPYDIESQGFFFAPNKDFAESFANGSTGHIGGKPRVVSAYIDMKHPADLSSLTYEAEELFRQIVGMYPSEYLPANYNIDQWWQIVDKEGDEYDIDIPTKLKELGYDGIIFAEKAENGRAIEKSYFVIEPNQIKSAEPVTYDDAGNVIPLSERFNEKKDDIRFSISGTPYSDSAKDVNNIKQSQLDIINNSNPMRDDVHLGIRSVDDIKTFDEAYEEGDRGYNDNLENIERAKKTGIVTIYSSKPIRQGSFVSTSKMMAGDYAGGKGAHIYFRDVPVENVAWINLDEGQYADTNNPTDDDFKKNDNTTIDDGKRFSIKAHLQDALTDYVTKVGADNVNIEDLANQAFKSASSLDEDSAKARKAISDILRNDKVIDAEDNVQTLAAFAEAMIHSTNFDDNSKRIALGIVSKLRNSQGMTRYKMVEAIRDLYDLYAPKQVSASQSRYEKLRDIKTSKTDDNRILRGKAVDPLTKDMLDQYKEYERMSAEKLQTELNKVDDELNNLAEGGEDVKVNDSRVASLENRRAALELALTYQNTISSIQDNIRDINDQINSLDPRVRSMVDEIDALRVEQQNIVEELGYKEAVKTEAYRSLADKISKLRYKRNTLIYSKKDATLADQYDALKDELRREQSDLSEAYDNMTEDLKEIISEGRGAYSARLEKKKAYERELLHKAFSDLKGVEVPLQEKNKIQSTIEMGWDILMSPTRTFDTELKRMAKNAPNGEGRLWQHFMRQFADARHNQINGINSATDTINAKMQELWGEKANFEKVYAESNREIKGYTITVGSTDENGELNGKTQVINLTPGQVMSIYNWNKQADGQQKLRAMNITQEDVDDWSTLIIAIVKWC